MKRVLVACGNGIATSTVVSSKIREYAEEKGVALQTDQCKLMEVPGKASNYDLVVTTGTFGGDVDTPVVRAISLLTGIGQEETLQEIMTKLEQ
ncbi:PTS sugar transporter subunit IIB [Marinilactibacillus psychrotolerans]|uniref:PTS galactitol transporter subunit IIB n=1 Tax=Marinilactibacillus psychrotolerans TaxID=191770 RepID=A0A5R9C152_9LACT|nr:PTS sugar transporter subunit IIB [Marinilactibacillus psychrotolerans]TLQ06401.1 PTS galactitol transporter subunit IIB [Marinilactibacillus psychrotolerans]